MRTHTHTHAHACTYTHVHTPVQLKVAEFSCDELVTAKYTAAELWAEGEGYTAEELKAVGFSAKVRVRA